MRRIRLKPSTLVLIVGVLFAVITIGSYAVSTIEDFNDHHAVTREVFFNVPGPLEAVFYGVLPMLFLAAAWLFSRRVRNWERGQPDNRRTTTKNVKRRVADFRAGVYMQTLLRDPAAGLMHSMIYFGFLSLAIVTAVLE